jgi:hypothetical protein
VDPQLQQIIDRAIADGLGDDDIDLLVQEHQARVTPVHGPPNQVTATTEGHMRPSDGPRNYFNQSGAKSALQAGVGVAKNLGGMVPALIHAVLNPYETGKNLANAQFDTFAKGDTAKTLPEKVAYRAAGMIPFIGPMAAMAGERIGSGEPEKMGAGATDAALLLSGSPMVRSGVKAGAKAIAREAAPVVERAASVAKPVVAAGKAVAKHPATKMAVGAGLGYAHGGLLGAAEGAVGGGILSKISKVLDANAASKSTGPVETRLNKGKVIPAKPPVDAAVESAVTTMRNEKAPNVLPGSHQPQGMDARTAPQMEALHDVLERQMVEKMKREQGVDLDNPVEAAYREMDLPGDDQFVNRGVQIHPDEPYPTAAEMIERTVDDLQNKNRGTAADVPDNPVAQALEAERQAVSAEAVPATEPPTIGSSKSKAARGADSKMSPNDRKVFADNIRKGMSEEEAIADMLRQRAERAQANYGRESAAAAARRKQQPVLPELREMLLNSLKERSGQ